MTREQQLQEFVDWWQHYCRGDEKGEAQIFLDRLFTAFGYPDGLKGAQGDPEKRIRFTEADRVTTRFADLVIPGRVLIEMKKRGEDLRKHHQQAFGYWSYLTPHPRYLVLCNFDEFWVYDMERQVSDPMGKIPVARLPEDWGPLAFLFPEPEAPVFNREFDLVELTLQAAGSLSKVFRLLIAPGRGIEREAAQRFILQCVLALFAEDIGLLPRYTFTRVIEDCQNGQDSHDLMTLLFIMMNTPGVKKAGRFFGVEYFDGGLFAVIDPINLNPEELRLLREAANHNWSRIRPSIFGTIFEGSMEAGERHQAGAHFTSDRDILRIVEPVIIRPWQERIEAAATAAELRALHAELCAYQVLDPACGSGNFLYIAYREMKILEKRLLDRLKELEPPVEPQPVAEPQKPASRAAIPRAAYVGPANPWSLPQTPRYPDRPTVKVTQFHGFDIKPFAVELAKVTLMIAKKMSIDDLKLEENALPLDNLDANIHCADALFADWPAFDACIGNPPYMGAKRLKQEHPPEYINRVRDAFPDVPGNADYCVYWFNKAHRLMQPGARAGLVGTNTIRQNYSREGGLDVILASGGTIYEAISSTPWSGEAAVHISIACWTKGDPPYKPARLSLDGETYQDVPAINSSLSIKTDVTRAAVLDCNTNPQRVFQGLTPGHDAFVLRHNQAENFISQSRSNARVIRPYLVGRDLIGRAGALPERFIINMNGYDIVEARQFKAPLSHLEKHVLPDRQKNALEEGQKNAALLESNPTARVNHHHEMFLRYWWRHSYDRSDMSEGIRSVPRYIVCSRVTKRPIFEFIDQGIMPGDSLQVFLFEDDYSFGILQSAPHWEWFTAKGSTLTERFRYTPNSVFDTFPWPQRPAPAQVKTVAEAGRALHEYRRAAMSSNPRLTLRDLYRTLELPGKNPLKDLHAALDQAVLSAYGFDPAADLLAQLLALNGQVAARLAAGEPVTAPGLPPDYPTPAELVSPGCITPPEWES